jgi:opine dehydrogenase
LAEAIRDADVVVLTVPTHGRRRILERAKRQLNQCSLLITWEGTGWFREDLVELGIGSPMAVGLQRSPLMSRIRQLGEKVEILGVRSEVVAAATRQEDRQSAGTLLTAILPFKIAMAPSYACVSVSPGNPLIHPARLYGWQIRGEPLPDAGLSFYGDWEDVSSMVLIEMHRELAGLRESLRLPKRFLKTLVDRQVVQTPRQVTHDIVSETCLHEIRVPIRQTRRGLALDRRHRFFREDIGQGLAHILDIARQAGVSMPLAAAIHRWYCGLSREHAIFRPALVDDAPGGRLR